MQTRVDRKVFERTDFGSFGWLKEGVLTPFYDDSFFSAIDSLARASFMLRERDNLIPQHDVDVSWIFKVVEVPFDASFFTGIDALTESFRSKDKVRLNPLSTDFGSFGWIAKVPESLPEPEVSVANFMRSMRMGIEYETILEAITPDDDNDLTDIGILYIGGAGNVKVDGVKGGTVTLVGVPAGTWLNFIRVKKVYATGTDVTNILVFY